MSISLPPPSVARRWLAVVLFSALMPAVVHAQYDLSGFLPPGVSVSNATPQQITEAVFAAAKQNPDAAADIAAGSFKSVFNAGRYTLAAAQDGKQTTDPDGSSGDPTLEEWAEMIGDAAKLANPSLGPDIDSAMASALSAAQDGKQTIDPDGSSGDPSGGGQPTPAGFPGGGGTQRPTSG